MEASIRYLTAQQAAMGTPAQQAAVPAQQATRVTPPAAPEPPKRPALDMQTSGGTAEVLNNEGPKDLNEAVAMYNEMQAKKGKKK
jgi:hypothetical protein